MCGGVIGDVFKSVDTVANKINPFHHFTQWATDNTVGKIPGIGKPMAQLGDWGNNHPAEVAALAAGGYGAYTLGAGALAGGAGDTGMFSGLGGAMAGGGAEALGGEAGAGLGAAGAGAGAGAASLDLGMAGAGAADAELSGLGGPTAGGFGGVGTDAAATGTGDSAFMSGLHSLFGGGVGSGGVGLNLATAKNGLGAMQVLSSLYGMDQSRKLSKQATAQSMSNAGLQAVQRSMAAQGYQGSGNMMQALSKYGADAYGANLGQQQASLSNTMSGLGLLTAGVGNLAGWGTTTPTKP